MDLLLNIDIKKLPRPINYSDKIMLVGSCFTEHIGNTLADLKFHVLQNPNGILFNPFSVSSSLASYIENRKYSSADLFELNDVWHSWQHHSRFSKTNRAEAVEGINFSQQKAHEFLRKADWLIITLGSSFAYHLAPPADLSGMKEGDIVTNCHRAPANWFSKKMLSTDEIINMLRGTLSRLQQYNGDLKFIFTISPVRHLRDGLTENNRSKARLLEAVHEIADRSDSVFYFPAYELVIDVLRDYRFYDIDLVHPNYAATQFVLEKFTEACIDDEAKEVMTEMKKIAIAKKHRPFQPDTKAHKQFLAAQLEKVKAIKKQYPFLDLEEEEKYFSN